MDQRNESSKPRVLPSLAALRVERQTRGSGPLTSQLQFSTAFQKSKFKSKPFNRRQKCVPDASSEAYCLIAAPVGVTVCIK